LVASCNLNIRRLTNRDEREEKMINGEGNEKNGGRRGKDDCGEEVKWLDGWKKREER
jgi:hypothetical protein